MPLFRRTGKLPVSVNMSNQNLFDESHQTTSETARLFGTLERERKKKNRRFLVVCAIIASITFITIVVILGVTLGLKNVTNNLPDDPYDRAIALLAEYPLIDGHNDLAYQIRVHFQNQFSEFDLFENGSTFPPEKVGYSWQTDIPRLKAGKIGAQFWAAFINCTSSGYDATRVFIDQIDVIKLLVKKYPDIFQFATSSSDITAAMKSNRIASLVGVEGGHAIDSSLGTLRQLYDLGARYMTLTHVCNTPWAHSSTDNSTGGLTDFGRKVVQEMNRLGMMVDISHVNNYTMMDVLDTSVAPVIFSHSSSYALCPTPRNVPDNVLAKLKDNNGIVMVNFYSDFINCTDPDAATVGQVADHIEHIKLVAGVDHVGIGSDFDGINQAPIGLEDVSKYPNLFAELIRRGFSDDDVKKISRLNLIRVLQDVEKASSELQGQFPDNTLISPQPNGTCRPDF